MMKNILQNIIRFFFNNVFFPCAKIWVTLVSKRYYKVNKLFIYTPLYSKENYQLVIEDFENTINQHGFEGEANLINKRIKNLVLLGDEVLSAPAWVVGETVFMESSAFNNKFGLFLFLVYYAFPINQRTGIFLTLDKLSQSFSSPEYSSLWAYWKEYFASIIRDQRDYNLK